MCTRRDTDKLLGQYILDEHIRLESVGVNASRGRAIFQRFQRDHHSHLEQHDPTRINQASLEPAAFSSQINLEPPSSVLPPSITPLSASSIVAPSSFTPVLPASGDVSSIVAPGGTSVPTVGATPSSGTGTIVPPTSSVTPPGGLSGGVVRPGGGGSSGGGTIKPLDYWVGNMCVIGYEGTRIGSGCSTRSLEETSSKQQDKINKETDTAERVELLEQLTLTQARIVDVNEFGRTGVSAQKALQRVYDSEAYQEATPIAQLKVGKQISSSLARGEIGGPWLKSLANVLELGFKLQSRSGSELRYPGMPESNQISPSLSQDFRRLGFASAAVMATGQLWLTMPANQTPPPGPSSVAAVVVIGIILLGVEIYTRSQPSDQKDETDTEPPAIPGPVGDYGNLRPNPEWGLSLPGIPGAVKIPNKPGGGRTTWKDKDGNCYEWDSRHGKLEVYNRRGKHQGEQDPVTGDFNADKQDKSRKPQGGC